LAVAQKSNEGDEHSDLRVRNYLVGFIVQRLCLFEEINHLDGMTPDLSCSLLSEMR